MAAARPSLKRRVLGGACVCSLAALTLTACPGPPQGGDGGAALLLLLRSPTGSQTRPCAGLTPSAPAGTALADTVTSAPGATGFGNGDSFCAVNGVRGLGNTQGSVDVYSLASSGAGATLILEWSGRRVTAGTGAEFIVFENPFDIGGNPSTRYMEPLVVEVSEDNASYCGWNPSYTFIPSSTYSNDPSQWLRFAGVNPVSYNQQSNPLNGSAVFSSGGGDSYDLADGNFGASGAGCNATVRDNIRNNGFVYLKLTSATSVGFPGDAASAGGPDIDGVIARYVTAR